MFRCLLAFCGVMLVPLTAIAQDDKLTPGQENLEQFEMLIGTWESKSGSGKTTRATYEWINNRSYILFKMGDYLEVIGWDLREGMVTSWGFGTHGGQGKLIWTKEGDVWKLSAEWLDRWGKTVPIGRTIRAKNGEIETTFSYGEKEATFLFMRMSE